jgi:hypothetical protein
MFETDLVVDADTEPCGCTFPSYAYLGEAAHLQGLALTAVELGILEDLNSTIGGAVIQDITTVLLFDVPVV